MPFHWTIHSIPELANLPKQQRNRLWRRCTLRSYRHRRVWAGLALAALFNILGGLAGVWLRGAESGWIDPLRLICSGIGVGIGVLLFSLILHPVVYSEIRAELGLCCRTCFYDLTGNQSGTCPECGTPVSQKAHA